MLFKELDTVSDLISYFTKKEKLLKSGKFPFVPQESDLLVMFLSNLELDVREHCFMRDADKFDTIFIDNVEDPYPDFKKRPDVQMRNTANKVSYLWDSIVEQYNNTLLQDKIAGEMSFAEKLKISELMSQENRYFRRILSEKLHIAYNTFKEGVIFMQSPNNPELAYACLILRRSAFESDKNYKERVSLLMEIYSKSLKMQYPQYKKILCFTRAFPFEERSCMYFSLFEQEITEVDREYVLECGKKYGIGTNFIPITVKHTPEYPKNQDALSVRFSKKIPVNAKCPCGSGKKYKKCCGKLY